MKNIIFKLLIFFIITSGCGYKVIKYSELAKLNINTIEATGDNEINFKIKRKLKTLSKAEDASPINIELTTTKSKFVKEKNSSNEVSKYQIDITVKLKVNSFKEKNVLNFTLKKTADFMVGIRQSKTREIEKRITNLLVDELVEELIEKLNLDLNDI